ncbi:uncharacterized protein LOC133188532 [Saccostrea echinata]|uniref:uncharacterized protein LOC133188532 n=1 Tax=Saccostrea echinata TaxID=191078 RepID=UPI002A8047D2|nr:uncharacterized protein LOC133188532 [Saccostrea echinata]
MLDYVGRKKKIRKGKIERNDFGKAMKQIAENLQYTGCLDVKKDALYVLTLWIDYIRELKSENSRIETLKTNSSRIDKMFQKMTKKIEVLEMQWNLLSKEDQSIRDSL